MFKRKSHRSEVSSNAYEATPEARDAVNQALGDIRDRREAAAVTAQESREDRQAGKISPLSHELNLDIVGNRLHIMGKEQEELLARIDRINAGLAKKALAGPDNGQQTKDD